MLEVNSIAPYVSKTNFKAQDKKAHNVSVRSTYGDKYDAEIKQLKAKEKKQKIKQNILTGISVSSMLAIIAMAFFSVKAMRGSAADNKKAEALKQLVKKITNPAIKHEAEAELARQPYERSLHRVEALIKLDELANKKEEKTLADIDKVRERLNKNIIGMDEAKDKIIQYLKTINYNIKNGIQDDKPIVLLIDGAPGTCKTTFAKEMADALGMYFKKVSLGGAKNAEEIVGFERTWAGAIPGHISTAQLEGNTKKVVYCFDEAEKASGEGPLNVLLPLFDNQRIFKDKYYNAEIDLSQSIFTLTTNDFKLLPEALQNRVQIIKIKDYTPDIKSRIAKLKINQELAKNKMSDKVNIDESVYMDIANLAEDRGGRKTTMLVDDLIEKIKGKLYDGETSLKVDSDFIKSVKLGENI